MKGPFGYVHVLARGRLPLSFIQRPGVDPEVAEQCPGMPFPARERSEW
jgi:hypothetical protein